MIVGVEVNVGVGVLVGKGVKVTVGVSVKVGIGVKVTVGVVVKTIADGVGIGVQEMTDTRRIIDAST